jgi:putative spermidine/putrescine transport system permease protein
VHNRAASRRALGLPRLLGSAWTGLVLLFVLAPFFCLIAVSLTPLDYISLPSGGISLRWYRALADHPGFLEAGLNSFAIALGTAASALVLGTMAALATVRYRFPGREAVRVLMLSPLIVPMVMTGLGILVFFSNRGWTDPATRLLVAHCALTLPYVVRTVSASLAGFDPNQELAARNMGASAGKAFLLVAVPQLAPGLLAGAIFAFVVSFDNVGLSIFLTGPQFTTLPVSLFIYATVDNTPVSAALSVVMVAISMLVVALLQRLAGLHRLMATR